MSVNLLLIFLFISFKMTEKFFSFWVNEFFYDCETLTHNLSNFQK